jgi:NAD(P)H-dependent FMN reductase
VRESPQRRSANRAAIAVAASHAAAPGATVDDFDRLADIPAFNADLDDENLDVVQDVARSSGIGLGRPVSDTWPMTETSAPTTLD